MRLSLLPLAALTLLPLMGCGEPFDSRTLVTGLRILAVKAEPPEAGPGVDVTYTALVTHPGRDGDALLYGFVACTPGLSGCLEQQEALAAAGGDEAQAQIEYQKTSMRYGIATVSGGHALGFGANMPLPLTLLDGDDGGEGRNAQLSFFACEADACFSEGALSGDTSAVADLPPEVSVLGLKRARVSTSDAPNQNPTVSRLELIIPQGEAVAVEEGGTLAIPEGEEVSLRAVLPVGAAEAYTFLDDDGVVEERVERMYVGWYSTVGEFQDATSTVEVDEDGVPSAQVIFTVPEGEGSGPQQLYVVVWDRRGGLGWLTANFKVEP